MLRLQFPCFCAFLTLSILQISQDYSVVTGASVLHILNAVPLWFWKAVVLPFIGGRF